MNLHVPQSEQTQNEIKMLAAVSTQIISPRESKPIVSVVQDVTLGIYRITKDDIRVSEKQLFNLLVTNTRFNGIIPEPIESNGDVRLWSGKQVLSTILPPTVNIKMANSQYDSDKEGDHKKNMVIVERGIIKQGTFDKTIYQTRTGGLIHSVYNENGQEETRHLFDNTQKLICNWLVQSGFSVGVSDLIVEQETKNEMNTVIANMKNEVYNIMKQIHEGTFENKSIRTNNDFFEQEVNNLLNEAINKVGKIGLKNIEDDNRMINMIKSGSKGKAINIAQMISSLGQQNVDGKRITYGFDDRTLPHYTKYDDGPEARGFVESSFIEGLSASEFMLHAIAGKLFSARKREQ
jgi:DNA-directed RNA polymerase II subunit RPB1